MSVADAIANLANVDEIAYRCTDPQFNIKPALAANQTAAVQAMFATVIARGGGDIIFPKWNRGLGVAGGYQLRDLLIPSGIRIFGVGGDGVEWILPPGSPAGSIICKNSANVVNTEIHNIVFNVNNQNGIGIKIIQFAPTSKYAWDGGGIFDCRAINAIGAGAVGFWLEYGGNVHLKRCVAYNCYRALELRFEHWYLEDFRADAFHEGIYVDRLLDGRWTNVNLAHSWGTLGYNGTAVISPTTGGPHIQNFHIQGLFIRDTFRGFVVRYMADCVCVNWRVHDVAQHGIQLDFTGACTFDDIQIISPGKDGSGNWDGFIIENSTSQIENTLSNVRARTSNTTDMRHGINLNAAPLLTQVRNCHVRSPKAGSFGFRTRPGMVNAVAANNIGTFDAS